jgi:histidyl-tRNA synthetase
VYVVQATEDAAKACRDLAAALRDQGVETLRDFEGKKMSAQLKIADKLGARFAAIIGTDELAGGAAMVRNLSSGDQSLVPFGEVGVWVRKQPR